VTRTGRLRWWICAAVCLGAVAWLLTAGLASNVQYFRTAAEAVAERTVDGSHTLRLAGAVVPGSIHQTANGVDFAVTDGHATVHVHHAGASPELFAAGAPVVCQGHWVHTVFASDLILIKHGSDYRPPTVATSTVATSKVAS
jgi:cytochrome c-type biogenesis protein CcmE